MGGLYALPNLFGEDLAVQVSLSSGEPVTQSVVEEAQRALTAQNLASTDIDVSEGRLLVRVSDDNTQLKAADAL